RRAAVRGLPGRWRRGRGAAGAAERRHRGLGIAARGAMKVTPLRIVLAAAVAGALGIAASLVLNGPGPLLGTEAGQRMLNDALVAGTPTPAGVAVARRGEALPAIRLAALDGDPIH